MARLLVVHHSPTRSTKALLDAALEGARHPDIEGVEVEVIPALEATADDVLAADGYLLGTPANFGYMSGALKHFFDTVYYPCLDATRGRPFGAYVHGNLGMEGAVKALRDITGGLKWRAVVATVALSGAPDGDARARCRELGATVAATLAL